MKQSVSDKKQRLAVYAIARNEEKHVSRFMQSIREEADLVLVLDTGSTDRTIELLRSEGAVVHQACVHPFRFDTARNTALALLPADIDICVALDLDEVLTMGWRQAILGCWDASTTRLHYRYVWNWTPSGQPGTVFNSDKIHSRLGYRWTHPVHEVLVPTADIEEKIEVCEGFTLEHHADPGKPRSQYLQLLELSVLEDPEDDRNSHYLAREYSFYQRWQDVIREGKRHLTLESARWHKERASSMRLISRAYSKLGDRNQGRQWLFKAIGEDPDARENYVEMGELCLTLNDYAGASYYASTALSLTNRELSYTVDEGAWTWKPHDLLGVAEYYLGNLESSLKHAQLAVEMNPHESRLKENLRLVEAALPDNPPI